LFYEIQRLGYYGARYYDPKVSVWLSVDPKDYAFPNVTPYSFNMSNPIMMIDPGGDSTIVVSLGKGKYEVRQAETKSGDRGVYVATFDKKGKRTLTGEKLGNSITTHSFVDKNNIAVKGAVIDMNSREGQNFVDEIIADDPNLFTYAVYPKTGGDKAHYDFKHRNFGDKADRLPYYYRGSVNSEGEIGSARDFGNIGAGIVAGRAGMSWGMARLGFDGYQGSSEPATSQMAQRIGYDLGRKLFTQDAYKNKRRYGY